MNSNSTSHDTDRLSAISFQIFLESMDASIAAAREIADLIPHRSAELKTCMLGLATGSAPVEVYAELVHLHQEESLSLANVVTVKLDKHLPIQLECLQSYLRFMDELLFDVVDIEPSSVNISDGTIDHQ